MFRAAVLLSFFTLAGPLRAQLGPPDVPPENPITEEKRILGKLLFWEEQLSSDNTMACGTCHKIREGGVDERFARHPGRDHEYFTYDDKIGSRGVRLSTSEGDYVVTIEHGVRHQVGRRTSLSMVMAAYHKELMWDGRAPKNFVDPETGLSLISNDGALESQSIGPILSSVEMAYPGRTWDDVAQKLAGARPMALATELPPDMVGALVGGTSYPALFEEAFGDTEITAARIAFAIATYERTLVPDQTPWDLFKSGQTDALTEKQQNGELLFKTVARCNLCHEPPRFTDDRFHNLGLRPILDDVGRYTISGEGSDLGRFKTPSLRNVNLRGRLFHTGRMPEFFNGPPPLGKSLVAEAMTIYILGGGPHQANLSPFMEPLPGLTDEDVHDIVDFVEHGLTDPRVEEGAFPFDSPTLFSQNKELGIVYVSAGIPGRAGRMPHLVVDVPPVIGGGLFRLGVIDARPQSVGWVSVQPASASSSPFESTAGWELDGPIFNSSGLSVDGSATWQVEFPDDPELIGRQLDMCWCIFDDHVPDRIAQTRTVRVTVH